MPAASGRPEASAWPLSGRAEGGFAGEEEGARAAEPPVPDQRPGDTPQVLPQGP